jgi:hypothetical protein
MLSQRARVGLDPAGMDAAEHNTIQPVALFSGSCTAGIIHTAVAFTTQATSTCTAWGFKPP